MGRSKKELSAEEIEERKRRWWGEEHNARRRARYASDPEYRARAIKNTRRKYQDRKPSKDFVHLNGVRDKIAAYGSFREVKMPDGRAQQMLVLTSQELGQVLNRTTNMIYRWRSSGKLPCGVMTTRVERAEVQVYSVAEVAAIVDVLTAHFRDFVYYHDKHTATSAALHQKVLQSRITSSI